MTSLTNSTRYTINNTVKMTADTQTEMVVIPTFVNTEEPTRKLIRAFQIRRRLSDFMANIISSVAFNYLGKPLPRAVERVVVLPGY